MGGRSGQSIARAASASEEAEVRGIAISGNRGSVGLTDSEIGREIRGLGVQGDVSVNFVGNLDGLGGSVAFVRSGKSARFVMEPKIEISDRGLSKSEAARILRHEATHLLQSQSGRFYVEKGYIYWEGKRYIGVNSYSKVLKNVNSRDPLIRKAAYKQYNDLPWEVEARSAE